MIPSNLIRITKHATDDGPMLLLFGPHQMDLASLQRCFRTLSKGIVQADLEVLPFVYPTDHLQLRLQSVGEVFKTRREAGLRLQPNSDSKYVWSLRNEDWERFAELLEPLINSPTSGHRHLDTNIWMPIHLMMPSLWSPRENTEMRSSTRKNFGELQGRSVCIVRPGRSHSGSRGSVHSGVLRAKPHGIESGHSILM